ncbi:MAG TPA: hypothetical protein PKW95_19610 [bacterium]|nr:hypothetical protein [bacterium]
MLFLAAIDRLNHEELLDLVAFGEAASFLSTLREPTEKAATKAKHLLGRAGQRADKALDWLAKKSENANRKNVKKFGSILCGIHAGHEALLERYNSWNFSPFTLNESIIRKRTEIQGLDDAVLRKRMLQLLCQLAHVPKKERENPQVISRAVLARAAKHMKIDTTMIAPEDVERKIFELHLEDLLKRIQAALTKGGPEMEKELEEHLQEVLGQLSRGEQEAMRQAMSLDELTAKSMLKTLRAGGMTLGTLAILNASGMGVFLMLTTMIKAFSLLLGTTFAFSTYMAATGFLGFLLGPIGIPLTVATAATGSSLWSRRKHQDALLTTLMASLHARLAVETPEN